MTITEAFDLAARHFAAGQPAQAMQLYQLILQAQPANAEVLFRLGIAADQNGWHDLAVQWLRQALAIEPRMAPCHSVLGLAYLALGRLEEAVASGKDAARLMPNSPEVHYNLASALHKQGRLQEAEATYRQSLRLRPGYPEALNNLGAVLEKQSRLQESETCYREALRLKQDFVDARNNLSNVLEKQGRWQEAEASFREVLRLKPDFPLVHYNLGNALREQKRVDEAEICYREAVRLQPNFSEAHNNLGNVLMGRKRLDDAEACFREALRLKPDSPDAYNNLGSVLSDLERLDEAEDCFRKALRLKPDFSEACNNLGSVLRDQRRIDEAEICYREAVRLEPDFSEGHVNLGNLLMDHQGRPGKAEICYREALRFRPELSVAHHNLGGALRDQGRLEEADACYREAQRLQPDDIMAHRYILFRMNYVPGANLAELLAEYRGWMVRNVPDAASRCGHDNDPSPERRLRVGYVSPDLRQHSVAFFFEPILAHHDPQQVEVFCYAEVTFPDDTTARLRSMAHHWRSTCDLTEEEVVDSVRADRIDVLVDLVGHTAGNRMPAFSHKPAPVQVTYLGYPSTTGVEAIDYRLTDAIADPPGMTEDYYTEQLVRLPGTFLCYGPPAESPDVETATAMARSGVVFGSFNNLAKVNSAVVTLWADVLAAVPGSRLLLKTSALIDEEVRRSVRERFADQGVDLGRLELRDWENSLARHLALYNEVDVALDTFPYCGTTTTCEALWMGVPVVTLAGDRHAARVGASLLTCVGLAELIAQSPEDYIDIARRLAADREGLVRLRCSLRERVRASPLCDGQAFTRRLEEAYRDMWRRWCARVQAASTTRTLSLAAASGSDSSKREPGR